METQDRDVPPPERHGPRRLLPEGSLAATGWDAAAAWFDRHSRLTDRWLIPAILFAAAWLGYAWLNRGQQANLAYFVPLADAFLHGRLGLTEGPKWLNELVPAANGLFYVVYPPMPALVVLPVVALFGPSFHQEWASIILGAANVALVSLVLRRMGVARGTRFVLSLVFAFGTVVWYSAQAGSSWHFAHVVATLFILLTIIGCQWDAPTWLIGLAFAGAALSRLPVAMAVPFLAAYLADRAIRAETGDRTPFGAMSGSSGIRRPPIRSVIRLAVPMAVGVVVPLGAYLAYDQLRFGSPFENGYALIPGLLHESQYRFGFFSVHNIPRQLYAMFLNPPVQVADYPWVRPRLLGGLSILLTTPLFIWVVKARDRDWFTVGAWVSVVLILVPVLTHADPGGAQWGYRYAQDIYPLLLLLTVRGLRGRIGFEAGLAIALGFVVNAWGMAISYTNGWA